MHDGVFAFVRYDNYLCHSTIGLYQVSLAILLT